MRNACSEASMQAVLSRVAFMTDGRSGAEAAGASRADRAMDRTLLQIHCARQRFVRGGAVLPWAYAITRRLLIDLGRRGGREELRARDVQDPDEPATAPSPEEALHRRRVGAPARANRPALHATRPGGPGPPGGTSEGGVPA